MNPFTWLFRPKQALPSREMRHFMRVIHGSLDHEIQLVDESMANRAKDAYRNGEFFRFSSLKGRQFTVNFRQVQAVRFSVMPETRSSSLDVDGGTVYLLNRTKPQEIPAKPEELHRFLDSHAGDGLIASLNGWQFDKHEIVLAVADTQNCDE